MTKKTMVGIDCPKCGQETETEVWSSLNVQINPEDKQKLLEGKINLFHCDNCGLETIIPATLLYHDMDIGFIVYYLPFDSVEQHFDKFTKNAEMIPPFELPENLGSESAYFSRIHYVFGLDELVRYVIFRDKLAQHKTE
jgi:hypothetical protein